MDVISNLSIGFAVAFAPLNLVFVTIGVVIGTLIGALPGISPVASLSFDSARVRHGPTAAMILMCGVYCSCMYGGDHVVLMNVPGESSSIMTCLDGNAMAKQGRAGPALTIAAIGSFVAGTFSVVMLTVLAPPIAEAALSFGPPEYFALMLLGLTAVTGLTGKSKAKGYAMALIGLGLAMIGLDPIGGVPRFTFGSLDLMDGLGFLPVAVGMFGLGSVLGMIDQPVDIQILKTTLRQMLITKSDLKESAMPIVRGSIIGFVIGVLPGAGATIASFLAYAAEKRLSKTPELFGTGMIAGVAQAVTTRHGRRDDPATHIGHPRLRNNRGAARRTDPLQLAAGPTAIQQEPGVRLGLDCVDVYRQCHAARAQHRLRARVRCAAAYSVQRARTTDCNILLGGRVQRELQRF
jgi:putative tricarboxylic transport membrane protein